MTLDRDDDDDDDDDDDGDETIQVPAGTEYCTCTVYSCRKPLTQGYEQ
jgi:hypothetical protein